jgi:hypothetical protein
MHHGVLLVLARTVPLAAQLPAPPSPTATTALQEVALTFILLVSRDLALNSAVVINALLQTPVFILLTYVH